MNISNYDERGFSYEENIMISKFDLCFWIFIFNDFVQDALIKLK